jgi:hypothetical protein
MPTFVRTKLISMDNFRTYSKLMNWHSKGDYGDMYDFEEDDIMSLYWKVPMIA